MLGMVEADFVADPLLCGGYRLVVNALLLLLYSSRLHSETLVGQSRYFGVQRSLFVVNYCPYAL